MLDELFAAADEPLPSDMQLSLELTLYCQQTSPPELYAALRVGADRLYVVRDIARFLQRLNQGGGLSFGTRLVAEGGASCFNRADRRIVQTLMEIEDARQSWPDPQSGTDAADKHLIKSRRFMRIPQTGAARLLNALSRVRFRFAFSKEIQYMDGVSYDPPPLRWHVSKAYNGIRLSAHYPPDVIQLTADFSHIYASGKIICLMNRGGKRAAPYEMLRALASRTGRYSPRRGRAEIDVPEEQAARFVCELLPKLYQSGEVILDDALASLVTRGELQTKIYLDNENREVTARVHFIYDDLTIEAFTPSDRLKVSDNERYLMRDLPAERVTLENLAKYGFRVRKGQAFLTDSQSVLRFFESGVKELMQRAEVYCSDRFQKIRPRKPWLSASITVDGGFTRFILSLDGEQTDDAPDILAALRDRRRYFRLRDGSFIDLAGFESWQGVASSVYGMAESGAATTRNGVFEASLFIMPEWLRLAEEDKERIIPGETALAMSRSILNGMPVEPPATLRDRLRQYQTRGFGWLTSLAGMRLGGVLADDMGLGKTIQTLAAVLFMKNTLGPKASLVVTPTTLIYNWKSECEKFTPELNCLIVDGPADKRGAIWDGIAENSAGNVADIIVTSYPLIRRDIDRVDAINFRFVILDEAQHIKNAKAKGALSVKRLNADARFALTGTPLENHPGELWSIFDFVLPGLLLTLPKFMAMYGVGQNNEVLRRRIEPFLLRRLKADVLKELPPKLTRTLTLDMPPEQKSVYNAIMQRAKTKIESILETQGYLRGRFEVLSLITELREIACHPSLKFEGYQGSSGKLDALMELLPGAIENGHRLLLFSSFTKMLKLLKAGFEEAGIDCLYLDGHTPTADRMKLVDQFNNGSEPVFLISLKAGGSGLNLTGADMVIHIDPWWNPAAEEQAADRAHRIGQTRVVEVIRLISRGTIEEHVDNLQRHKKDLYDKLIPSAGRDGGAPLTEKDIWDILKN